jgi:hypothetical protein
MDTLVPTMRIHHVAVISFPDGSLSSKTDDSNLVHWISLNILVEKNSDSSLMDPFGGKLVSAN